MYFSVAQLKAKCLALLDEAAKSGSEPFITKSGRPVARVVPVDEAVSLHGTVTYRVSDDELIAPIEAAW